jgi:hypothetical protein
MDTKERGGPANDPAVPEWVLDGTAVADCIARKSSDLNPGWWITLAHLLGLLRRITEEQAFVADTSRTATVALWLRAHVGVPGAVVRGEVSVQTPEGTTVRETGGSLVLLTRAGHDLAGQLEDSGCDRTVLAGLLDDVLNAIAGFATDLLATVRPPDAASGRSRAKRPAERPAVSGDNDSGAGSGGARPRVGTSGKSGGQGPEAGDRRGVRLRPSSRGGRT